MSKSDPDVAELDKIMASIDQEEKSKESKGPFPGYELKGGKEGGAHGSHADCGMYKKDGKTSLLKREIKDLTNDMAEFSGAAIFNAVTKSELTPEGSGCKVNLVKNQRTEETFLQSEFLSDYKGDLWKHIDPNAKNRSEGVEAARSAVGSPQLAHVLTAKHEDGPEVGKPKYENTLKTLIASSFIGDYSVHSGNFGVTQKDQGPLVVKRFDFGSAQNKQNFETDIRPFKNVQNNVGRKLGVNAKPLSKNYLTRDFDTKVLFTKEASDMWKQIANTDLKATVEQSCKQMKEAYTEKDAGELAKYAKERFGAESIDALPQKMTEKFQARQQSAKNIATEIDIYNAVKSKTNVKGQLETIEKENPQFFKDLLEGKAKSQMGEPPSPVKMQKYVERAKNAMLGKEVETKSFAGKLADKVTKFAGVIFGSEQKTTNSQQKATNLQGFGDELGSRPRAHSAPPDIAQVSNTSTLSNASEPTMPKPLSAAALAHANASRGLHESRSRSDSTSAKSFTGTRASGHGQNISQGTGGRQ